MTTQTKPKNQIVVTILEWSGEQGEFLSDKRTIDIDRIEWPTEQESCFDSPGSYLFLRDSGKLLVQESSEQILQLINEARNGTLDE